MACKTIAEILNIATSRVNAINIKDGEVGTGCNYNNADWDRELNAKFPLNPSTSGSSKTGKKLTDTQTILEQSKGSSRIADLTATDSIDAMKFAFFSGKEEKEQMMSDAILDQLKRESDLRTEIAEKTSITGELLSGYVDDIAESSTYALKFGYNLDQVRGLTTKISEGTGKFSIQSKEFLDRSYGVSRAFVGTLTDLGSAFVEFQKVGIGASETLDAIDKAGRSSVSLGLNAKKTTETLKNEIGKLNEYGFRGGVDGLNRMVQRSIELRMNLSETFKLAEKVMSPESAIELTANMQMLGGAIGDLNDPLKLMYMATNNVEGLQDALMGAVENLATYNEEQGRFEVVGANMRRVREMATAMGVDYKELTKSAVAAQERMMATESLMGRGLNISEKDREFIVNMAQMKDGKMTLSLPSDVAATLKTGTEVALDELNEEQIGKLRDLQDKLVGMDSEKIALEQFTSVKQIELMMKASLSKDARALMKASYGAGGAIDVNEILGDKENGKSLNNYLRTATEQQRTGRSGVFTDTLESIGMTADALKTVLKPVGELFVNQVIEPFSILIEKATKNPETPEQRERREKIEYDKSKTEPISMNLKHTHEFKINKTFESGMEYVRSYTEPPVMA